MYQAADIVPTESPDIDRTRTFAWQNPDQIRRHAMRHGSLEFLARVKAGEIRAPIQDTLDFSLEDFGEGWCIWSFVPGEYQYNPMGSVHGGVSATLLDTAMTVALWSTLPQGMAGTTLELKVNFIRPITVATGRVISEGKAIHSGRSTGTAEGRITDAEGNLIAHGTTTCLAFDPRSARAAP